MTMPDQTANNAVYPDPGEVPVLDWIDKSAIFPDPLYQRPLDDGRVNTILRAFSWRSFGALVVVPQADGTYHVPDGQHRLEAAKLHPRVQHVPCVIVKADDVPAEASVFVEINKNRKNVTALELFFAQLAAGDGEAEAMLKACQEAGIRIPKHPGDYKPNDSIAVAAIASIVSGYIVPRAIEFLKIAAAGNFTPITAAQIKAVEHLRTDPEFRNQITGEDLAALLAASGKQFDGEAKRFAATHKVSMWKALANVWFKACKKRKPAATVRSDRTVEPGALPFEPSAHVREVEKQGSTPTRIRTVIPHALPVARNVTSSVMGDPPAGRSALDQRRQG